MGIKKVILHKKTDEILCKSLIFTFYSQKFHIINTKSVYDYIEKQ